jgi:hypothetical protein
LLPSGTWRQLGQLCVLMDVPGKGFPKEMSAKTRAALTKLFRTTDPVSPWHADDEKRLRHPGQLYLTIGERYIIPKNVKGLVKYGVANGMMGRLVDVVLKPGTEVRWSESRGSYVCTAADVSVVVLKYLLVNSLRQCPVSVVQPATGHVCVAPDSFTMTYRYKGKRRIAVRQLQLLSAAALTCHKVLHERTCCFWQAAHSALFACERSGTRADLQARRVCRVAGTQESRRCSL